MELLTDLQTLGCELHKNAFDGRALAELLRSPRHPGRYKGEGWVRKRLGRWMGRKDIDGREGEEG